MKEVTTEYTEHTETILATQANTSFVYSASSVVNKPLIALNRGYRQNGWGFDEVRRIEHTTKISSIQMSVQFSWESIEQTCFDTVYRTIKPALSSRL